MTRVPTSPLASSSGIRTCLAIGWTHLYGDRNVVCSCPPIEEYAEFEFSDESPYKREATL